MLGSCSGGMGVFCSISLCWNSGVKWWLWGRFSVVMIWLKGMFWLEWLLIVSVWMCVRYVFICLLGCNCMCSVSRLMKKLIMFFILGWVWLVILVLIMMFFVLFFCVSSSV